MSNVHNDLSKLDLLYEVRSWISFDYEANEQPDYIYKILVQWW